MTRAEFIDGYLRRTRWNEAERTPEGFRFRIGDSYHHRVALPCACGDESCEGWAMVLDDPDSIALHNRVYGPR